MTFVSHCLLRQGRGLPIISKKGKGTPYSHSPPSAAAMVRCIALLLSLRTLIHVNILSTSPLAVLVPPWFDNCGLLTSKVALSFGKLYRLWHHDSKYN